MGTAKTKKQMDLKITIEDVAQDDIKAIQKLFSETIHTSCKKDYSKEQIEAWASSKNDDPKWLDKVLNQYFLIARNDIELLGFGSLENNDHLDLLYVHKDYQGKGIAGKLLQVLEKKAEINRAEKISTYASKTARAFFEKNGYKVIKEQKVTINETDLVNYKMVKKLGFLP